MTPNESSDSQAPPQEEYIGIVQSPIDPEVTDAKRLELIVAEKVSDDNTKN